MENTTAVNPLNLKEDLSKLSSMSVLLIPPLVTEFSEPLKELPTEDYMFPITLRDSPDSNLKETKKLMTPKFTEIEFSESTLTTTIINSKPIPQMPLHYNSLESKNALTLIKLSH